MEPFAEPEAPPNSVERVDERTIGAYDDDILDCDVEEVELF